MPVPNKLGRVMRYNEELRPIKPDDHSVTCLLGHVTYNICCISTCTSPMDTRHRKVVTYREGHLLIKSHDHLNSWSCKVL